MDIPEYSAHRTGRVVRNGGEWIQPLCVLASDEDMTANPTLEDIQELLASGEESERQARAILEQEDEPGPCASEFNSPACRQHQCDDAGGSMTGERHEEIQRLFDDAWQVYHEAESLLREYVREMDSITGYALLAQVLLDIHIHPGSGFQIDTAELWESQYLWLHLYYRTREQYYFDRAKLCDGIRHAVVEKVAE